MAKLIMPLLLVLGSGAWAQESQLKGFRKISLELSNRIAPRNQVLPLMQFVPAPGIEALLGTWLTFANVHAYHNGNPNPVNMVIWNVIASQFAESLGQSCIQPKMPFNPEFLKSLNALCAWPADSAKTEEAMTAYWILMMGYDAPEQEFRVWREFFLNSEYASKSGAEAVQAMSFAILMNPYFNLEK
jgi:hypothetical protein